MTDNVEPTVKEVNKPREKVYWAPSRKFQLGNFQEEVRDGGRIVKREVPLRFDDHVFVTNKPGEIDYIESSEAFASNTIRECADMAEANKMTKQQAAMKSVRKIETETTESVIINPKE